jgi:hypothetical protein
LLPTTPPTETTLSSCVSFLNPSMPPFGIDWSSATARFS